MSNPHNPDSAEVERTTMEHLKPLVFDIETGVRDDVLANPADWFRPDARLKDPAKIEADLREKAEAGALSPLTGQILAIGFAIGEEPPFVYADGVGADEFMMISHFLDLACDRIRNAVPVVGFNILDFDLPFIMFRARRLGIRIPVCLGSIYKSKWNANDGFVDLMLRAQFGRFDRAGYSLDRVCRAFGIRGKTGNGAHFQATLRDNPEAAIEYLKNDVAITAQLASKLL